MSLAHIGFIRTENNSATATYRVESPDFDISRELADLGILKIDKHNHKYDFLPTDLWLESRAIPPFVYALEEAERDKILKIEFPKHAWGAWSMMIHYSAMVFLEKSFYPETYPKNWH